MVGDRARAAPAGRWCWCHRAALFVASAQQQPPNTRSIPTVAQPNETRHERLSRALDPSLNMSPRHKRAHIIFTHATHWSGLRRSRTRLRGWAHRGAVLGGVCRRRLQLVQSTLTGRAPSSRLGVSSYSGRSSQSNPRPSLQATPFSSPSQAKQAPSYISSRLYSSSCGRRPSSSSSSSASLAISILPLICSISSLSAQSYARGHTPHAPAACPRPSRGTPR